jgi:ATP-binding cassette subfamily B protein
MPASGPRTPSDDKPIPPPLTRLGHPASFVPAVRLKTERAKNPRNTVARLWPYLKRHRGALVASTITAIVAVSLDISTPFLIGRAIDRYLIPRNMTGLKHIATLLLMVYASSAALGLLQSYVMTSVSQKVVRDIRADLFGKIQQLPLRFFDQRSHGDLMSRLTNDLDSLNQVLGLSVTQLASGFLSMAGVLCIMLFLNPYLTVACVLTSAMLILGVNRWIAKKIRQAFRLQQAALGRLNGFVEETVVGQKTVKLYHHEQQSIEQFSQANQALLHDSRKAQIFGGLTGPMAYFSGDLGQVVVAFTGGILAVRGLATIGTVASFASYTRQFSRPLNEMANLYNQILSALAGAERVFQIIDESPEVDAQPAAGGNAIRGEVVFHNVSFSYEPGNPVLSDVSLHLAQGTTVAIIGATGSGKTTIVNLLTRFHEIESGSILIDGQDIRDIPKDELRQQIGVVLQDTFLFHGTVRDNIRYGRLDASDDEVARSAKLANADVFIHRLPNGYDTMLSERGSNLSHGQRQLLSIARTILADPRILVLDEATSSVDTRTEKHIQVAMRRLMAGRTCLVIAHRLSTVRDADAIVVLQQGRIVRRGTHKELFQHEVGPVAASEFDSAEKSPPRASSQGTP